MGEAAAGFERVALGDAAADFERVALGEAAAGFERVALGEAAGESGCALEDPCPLSNSRVAVITADTHDMATTTHA